MFVTHKSGHMPPKDRKKMWEKITSTENIPVEHTCDKALNMDSDINQNKK